MDPVTAAALIGGGSQLLGGLLGKGKKPQFNFREKRRMEEERFKWLVKGARNAGFNPLTVLRSTGGGQGNMATTTSPLGSRAAVGEAIKTFGGTYAQDAIQRATEERAQEDWKERWDYQIENPLQPVRKNTGGTSTEEKTGTFDTARDDYIGQIANPMGARPEEIQIPLDNEKYGGRYVLRIGQAHYMMPYGWVPTEGVEANLGSGLGEIHGIQSLINLGQKVRVTREGHILVNPETPPTPLNTGGPANRAGGI